MKIWSDLGKTMNNCLNASQVFCTLSLCLQLKLSTRSQKKKGCLSFILSVNRGRVRKKEDKQWLKLLVLNFLSINYSPALVLIWQTGRRTGWRSGLMSSASQGKGGKMCVRSSESFWQQRQSSSEPLSLSLTPPLPLSPPPLSQSLPLKITLSLPKHRHTLTLSLTKK